MRTADISQKLKTRRLQAGLSLSQVARRTNTSVATLSRYENGWERFELYTLRKLATALGCRLRVELEPMEGSDARRPEASGWRGLRRLFWDRQLRRRDLDAYPQWVLERVLEYGSLDDLRFLIARMGRRRFLEGVAEARFTSAKTANFWRQLLEREDIPCARKFSREEAKPYWPS